MKRKALGRGLAALIPDVAQQRSTGDLFVCPIEKIKPAKRQPRKYFDDQLLQELVASIKAQGVVQPLVVRPDKNGSYVLVVGERRWRAAQAAGLHDVPVVIRSVSEEQAFEMALVENLHRADLNPVEEAEAYRRLLDEHGYTQDKLAESLGRDRSTVTNTLRLLKSPVKIQKALIAGAISPGHARALLSLEKASLMERVARQIIERQLSVRQTESLVKQLQKGATTKRTPPSLPPNARDLQERLCRSLKTRVRLLPKQKDKGRIEIVYNSLDELDRLLEVLLK